MAHFDKKYAEPIKRQIQVNQIHGDFSEFSKPEIKKSVLWRKLLRGHQNESRTFYMKWPPVIYLLFMFTAAVHKFEKWTFEGVFE